MNDNNVMIYQDENGITKVSVRFSDEDIWVTQQQLAEVYDTTQQNISQHIDGIYKDGELAPAATNKKFLLVRTEGNRQVRRNINHYNLERLRILLLLLGRTNPARPIFFCLCENYAFGQKKGDAEGSRRTQAA